MLDTNLHAGRWGLAGKRRDQMASGKTFTFGGSYRADLAVLGDETLSVRIWEEAAPLVLVREVVEQQVGSLPEVVEGEERDWGNASWPTDEEVSRVASALLGRRVQVSFRGEGDSLDEGIYGYQDAEPLAWERFAGPRAQRTVCLPVARVVDAQGLPVALLWQRWDPSHSAPDPVWTLCPLRAVSEQERARLLRQCRAASGRRHFGRLPDRLVPGFGGPSVAWEEHAPDWDANDLAPSGVPTVQRFAVSNRGARPLPAKAGWMVRREDDEIDVQIQRDARGSVLAVTQAAGANLIDGRYSWEPDRILFLSKGTR